MWWKLRGSRHYALNYNWIFDLTVARLSRLHLIYSSSLFGSQREVECGSLLRPIAGSTVLSIMQIEQSTTAAYSHRKSCLLPTLLS